MPLYFFDSGDGDCFLRGDVGVELPGPQEACDEAVRLLPSIARDMGARYAGHDIVSAVRNERNQVIFRAMLSLKTEWLGPQPDVRDPARGGREAPGGGAAGPLAGAGGQVGKERSAMALRLT